MKNSACVALVMAILLLVPAVISARHIGRPHSRSHHGHHQPTETTTRNGDMVKPSFYRQKRKADTVQVAGSSLPDCSHACGSCSPCRLVMVSFVCSSLEEAETCPMAYKCMCKNKSYPVP
ncbi:hypothetical protein L1049_023622 [Liquidambar formosana]|uniref:Epidermal patterning factor-like protein n=1 Tax=Liquidambar formosana TaxID=63359 RepID=A0AAP0RZT9_LIQFO